MKSVLCGCRRKKGAFEEFEPRTASEPPGSCSDCSSTQCGTCAKCTVSATLIMVGSLARASLDADSGAEILAGVSPTIR